MKKKWGMEMERKDWHRYDDMLDMPHHQSMVRPHMSKENRAAQFAPFAALTGYEEAIRESSFPIGKARNYRFPCNSQ